MIPFLKVLITGVAFIIYMFLWGCMFSYLYYGVTELSISYILQGLGFITIFIGLRRLSIKMGVEKNRDYSEEQSYRHHL